MPEQAESVFHHLVCPCGREHRLEVRSILLSQIPIQASRYHKPHMGKNKAIALDVLRRLLIERRKLEGDDATITVNEWREACDLSRQRWNEVVQSLVKDNLVESPVLGVVRLRE